MENLEGFRNQVQNFLRLAGLSQKSLAAKIGLNTNVLSRKFNGLASSRLTHPEVKQIILALADWQAINTREQALQLMELMDLPENSFAPQVWKTAPLNQLLQEGEILPISHKTFKEPAAPTSPEPPVGNSRPRSNLPAPLTSLVGREWAIATLRDLLSQPQVRLITLTGTGGVGKTRLSLEVARQTRDLFEGGTYFVGLAALRNPALVLTEIAVQLRVKETQGFSTLEGLQRALGSQPTLLILDNFEHLLEAAGVVGELLEGNATLKILVSSREVLHVYGEYQFGVPPLDLPSLAELPNLTELAKFEAIQLFVERTGATNPEFEMAQTNRQAVAEICCLLDGLPLPIELAAARTRLFTIEVLLHRLKAVENPSPATGNEPGGGRLKILTGGPRNLPSRQQTLRNAIEWSYNLLEPSEQALFARLGIFVGGFSLEAAWAVCGWEFPSEIEIMEKLGSLLDKSLLVRGPVTNRARVSDSPEAGTEAWLGMLETLREFALENLTKRGELVELKQRHARYYTTLAETAEPDIIMYRQFNWLERLEAAHDNFRVILSWATQLDAGEIDRELGLRTGAVLWRFWLSQGYFSEGRNWLAHILDDALPETQFATTPEGVLAIAKARHGAGMLAFYQGDYRLAVYHYEQSLHLFRQLENKAGMANLLSAVAQLARMQGDFARMRSLYDEAITLFEELQDGVGICSTGLNFSIGLWQAGNYREARRLATQSLAFSLTSNHPFGIAGSHLGLGWIDLSEGDLDSALEHFRQAAAFKALNKRYYAQRLLGEGYAYGRQGEIELARSVMLEGLAIQLKNEMNDRWAIAWFLYGLAELAVAEQHWRQAARLVEAAKDRFAVLGVPRFAFLQECHAGIEAALTRQLSSAELEQAKEEAGHLELTELYTELKYNRGVV